jgi:hypothetical protein
MFVRVRTVTIFVCRCLSRGSKRQTETGLIESKNLTPFNWCERESDFGGALAL